MGFVGHHSGLTAGKANRRHPEIRQRHADERHADALTGGQQHIEFAAIGMRTYLIGHLDKLVGGPTHRRDDRHDTTTPAMQCGKTARNGADSCRRFKAGAAVFLHDDGDVAHYTDKIP